MKEEIILFLQFLPITFMKSPLCQVQVSSRNFNLSGLNDKYIHKKSISVSVSQIPFLHEDEYCIESFN